MMGELIVRNLLHRPMRTLIGAMGIAVEVALVVLIVGLTSGLLTETAKRIEGIGADIMLQALQCFLPVALGGAPMPVKIGDKLAEMKYVQSVAPVLFQFNTSGVGDRLRNRPRELSSCFGGFVFLEGHDMEGPDDILVDDIAAKVKKLQAGDTYRNLHHDWRVAGIVEHGKGSRLLCLSLRSRSWSGRAIKPASFLEVHAPRAHRRRLWRKCTTTFPATPSARSKI